MSTENPRVSNFRGIDGFQELIEKIEIRTTADETPLSFENDGLQVDPSELPILGLTFDLPFETKLIEAASEESGIDANDVDLYVISEDSFLKERDATKLGSLTNVKNEVVFKPRGHSRHKSLQNSLRGFRLELCFVLNRELELSPGRPHRFGTKLATFSVRVTPYPDAGAINPIELTQEVRRRLGLSQKTHLFVEFADDLLLADSLNEAMVIHVDGELLRRLKARRTGIEQDVLLANIAINSLQQLVYRISNELTENAEFVWEEANPVLSFLHEKLLGVSRVGRSKPSKDELVTMLRSESNVVASLMTGLSTFSNDARKLLQFKMDDDGDI